MKTCVKQMNLTLKFLELTNLSFKFIMSNKTLKLSAGRVFFATALSTAMIACFPLPSAAGNVPLGAISQTGGVKGTIVDSNGEPVIGATVRVDGTNIATVSDIDGSFVLNNVKDGTMTVSFIGYKTQTVKFTAGTPVNVKLEEDTEMLDDVVVVGYGTMKRKNFTGAVSTVETANTPLSLMPTTDPMSMLRGTTTGLTVSQPQGAGQTASMVVRGQKSVNGGSDPLLVVDGVIYMGTLRDIDPSTIQSMSILKDATSLAAYGSQAANGVIMVTTKKGKLGKPVVNVNTSWAFSGATAKPDVLSPQNYVKKVNALNGLAEDADPTWMREFEYANYKAGRTTDWFDYVTRTGVMQTYSASVSGATEKLNYYMSGSYTGQKGLVIGDDYKRTNFSTRLQSDITDWLQLGGAINYTFNNYSGATVYNFYQTIRMSPYGQPTRENGMPEKYPVNEGIYRTNPLWDVLSNTIDDHDTYATTMLTGHVLIKCPWIEGLSYRMNARYSTDNIVRDYFTHEGYYVKEGTGDERYDENTVSNYLASANGYNARTKNTYWVWDHIVNFNRQFGKHYIDVTYVYTRDSKEYSRNAFTGSDFSALGNTMLGYDGLRLAATQKISDQTYTRHTDVGYLGRISYNYDDTYHLNVSVRRDGSSVFGTENKWGTFPAVGGAWTMSNEPFIQNIKAIDYLKLKLSWGKNGNQSLSPYQTLSKITLGQMGGFSYPFGNTSEVSWGQRITVFGNPTLGWEETESWNYGFELGLFKNRVHLDFDGYFSKTTNQIFDRSIPVMINGLTSMKATMGRVDNWGLEFTLTTENIKTKDLYWQSSLNFYINRNKLKELYGDGKDDKTNSLFLGKSLGAIYGYKAIGIVQEDDKEYIEKNGAEPGDAKFADVDKDGVITDNDRTILGYRKENFRMNLGNTIQYKNFELYFLFTGVFGGGGYGMAVNRFAYQTSSDVQGDNNLNHGWWTAENRSDKYPRINYTSGDYMPLQCWGFVRLSDLSLSYSFKQPWMKTVGLEGLKLYMACKNLFTITGWEGGDPEIQQTLPNAGYSYGYPLSRTVSFGVNLTF